MQAGKMLKEENGIVHKHHFQKSSADSSFFCHICQNMWEENGVGVLSKFYTCGPCGVNAHTSCRFMAERCYPCDNTTKHTKMTTEDSILKPLRELTGHFAIRLLNAYDLDSSQIPRGTNLYGIFSIPTEEGVIRTSTACKGENDCVWPSDASGGFDSDSDFILSYTGHSNNLLLRIELWRSVMFVWDSLIASAEVSLLPLLYYPDNIVERWFGITASGERCGAVLLRIQFIPNTPTASAFSTPTKKTKGILAVPIAPFIAPPITSIAVLPSAFDDTSTSPNPSLPFPAIKTPIVELKRQVSKPTVTPGKAPITLGTVVSSAGLKKAADIVQSTNKTLIPTPISTISTSSTNVIEPIRAHSNSNNHHTMVSNIPLPIPWYCSTT